MNPKTVLTFGLSEFSFVIANSSYPFETKAANESNAESFAVLLVSTAATEPSMFRVQDTTSGDEIVVLLPKNVGISDHKDG